MKPWRRRGGIGVVNFVLSVVAVEAASNELFGEWTWAGPDPFEWQCAYSINGGAFVDFGQTVEGFERAAVQEDFVAGDGDQVRVRCTGQDVSHAPVGPSAVSEPITWSL